MSFVCRAFWRLLLRADVSMLSIVHQFLRIPASKDAAERSYKALMVSHTGCAQAADNCIIVGSHGDLAAAVQLLYWVTRQHCI